MNTHRTMTPEAKTALARTIRGTSVGQGGLRQRLLDDLHNATETAYRFSVRAQDAGLDEDARTRRHRFELWIEEQRRSMGAAKSERSAIDFRRDAEKQAAYTWLNRIIVLRLMEATELRAPKVITGGWESPGYKDFRSIAQSLVRGDPTEGYAFLLGLVFEDLATELPGIFGTSGVAELVPMPAATLRFLVEALDEESLESCWTDDMTLGWVYQYWNDPEREAIDAKLNGGGKVAPHEIASKTQMFTERYMVDWLLQNSLGPQWLAICGKHGWAPEVEADGTLARLEQRRVAWRARREAGEVQLTALMPLETHAERCWAYYVPQALPDDAVTTAPQSVRDLKLLDPAVGSGHFLVVAFELLVALYREEARHRGEAGDAKWTDAAIVERILEHNLHGIDLDPRAVQIAAAALWLKARQITAEAKPRQFNLVAANLRLSRLPDDDPALLELRCEVERETGIPAALTDTIINALSGADHLGSLLKIDDAVDKAFAAMEKPFGALNPVQGDLMAGFPAEQQRLTMTADAAKKSLTQRLEDFLSRHTAGDDLGLRLRGEQLAAGVRFARLLKEGSYDLVVANPPYQGTAKMQDSKYVETHYPLGKADLYAAFLLRGLELVREGGVSAMLTMRNWMFIKQYSGLRERLLGGYDLRALGDFDRGAFESVPDEVVSVTVSVFAAAPVRRSSVALCPTPRDDTSRDNERTHRKRAATLCQVGRHQFDPAALKVVPEWPLIYWWDSETLFTYASNPKLEELFDVRQGLCTGNNTRALRAPWELDCGTLITNGTTKDLHRRDIWLPFIKGGEGRMWFEPLHWAIYWGASGLCIRTGAESGHLAARPQNQAHYMRSGVAIQTLGSTFAGRLHRYPSIFGDMARSIFGGDPSALTVLMNSRQTASTITSLNPTIHFTVGDLKRVPYRADQMKDAIISTLTAAFEAHESHREPSIEFKSPGPSPWSHAQEWAQAAVDRPEGAPLPGYSEELDSEPPTDHISFALGVTLGRFSQNGLGILDPTTADLSKALPAGICFLDGSLESDDPRDSLGHDAAKHLHSAWDAHRSSIDPKRDLRSWLRLKFFGDVHKSMYENRPIHWPLSSGNKTFVAWVNIHRFNASTLRVLQADHLAPALKRIEGELTDLRVARDGADAKAARNAERRFDSVLKAKNELVAFVALVVQCADRGPPPTDPNPSKCALPEVEVRYEPHLDDGVMINSAALWPLLLPQWKDPKKWWTELCQAKGRKDYDWSHLARGYWPRRVDTKCQQDPSLGVAHGCFWTYHPRRAWAWELRLQDEINADFRIEEPPYQHHANPSESVEPANDVTHRAAYLRDHAEEALAAVEKEAMRRRGRGDNVKNIAEMTLLESGLWSALPAECCAMEQRISEKQGAPFVLNAPDSTTARATHQAQFPNPPMMSTGKLALSRGTMEEA